MTDNNSVQEISLPIISAYQNGMTAHIPRGSESMHERAKRDVIKGWSTGAVRRHTKFLYSIPLESLDGYGYAVTLTVRDCPPSSAEFHARRRAFLKRMDRAGAVRTHWVIEWQRRVVPHLHMAIYFPHELSARDRFELVNDWVELTDDYGSTHSAQDIKPITGACGWIQYLSKHAARGAAHYQRQGKPAGWESTGRLWGHSGAWTVLEPMKFDVPREAYFRYRRLVRAMRYANARMEKDLVVRRNRMLSARHMLRANDRKVAEVRGVSQWVDLDTNIQLFALLASDGFEIRQVDA